MILQILFNGCSQNFRDAVMFLLGGYICFDTCLMTEMKKDKKGNENQVGN